MRRQGWSDPEARMAAELAFRQHEVADADYVTQACTHIIAWCARDHSAWFWSGVREAYDLKPWLETRAEDAASAAAALGSEQARKGCSN
jgi:hypothetical protein